MNLLDDAAFAGVADEIASTLKRRKFVQCLADHQMTDLFCPANLAAWSRYGLLADRCKEMGSDKEWAAVGLERMVALRLAPVFVEEQPTDPLNAPAEPPVASWCWMSSDSPKAGGCRLSVRMCKAIEGMGTYKLRSLTSNNQGISTGWQNRVIRHKTIVTALLAAAGALAQLTEVEAARAAYSRVKSYKPQGPLGSPLELSQLESIDHGN